MLDPAVHAQLAAILPPSALLTAAEETTPYECDGLTMYRELPAAVAIPENEAQVVEILKRCHAARVPVVARGAGTEPFRRRVAGQAGRAAVAGEIPPDPRDRSAGAHGGRAAGRAQPRDLRGRGAVRPLLRAGPVVADRLHDRRQRRRERRRRALSQVRAHRAQRPPRARRARSPARSSNSAATRSTAPATTCSRSSTAPRACWPSSPRSPSS